MWPRDVTNVSHFFQEEKAEVRFFRSLLPLLPPPLDWRTPTLTDALWIS